MFSYYLITDLFIHSRLMINTICRLTVLTVGLWLCSMRSAAVTEVKAVGCTEAL